MSEQIKIDDQQGIINSLQARIRQLECQVSREQLWQAESLPGAIRDTLKHLRARGVILLCLGDDLTGLRSSLTKHPDIEAALDQVWPLESAPVSFEVKQALRLAANNGIDRWS